MSDQPDIPADMAATFQVAAQRVGDVAIKLSDRIEGIQVVDAAQVKDLAEALSFVAGALADTLSIGESKA